MNKVLILLASILIFAGCSSSGEKETVKGDEAPNIIFILTDDQRWDALAYAGNEHIRTPEMDKLAQRGVYFKNAIASTPICSASRASIFCGLHERTHRYTFQSGPIRSEFMEASYPKILKKEGYYLGFYGKFGVAYDSTGHLFDRCEVYDRNDDYDNYKGYFYKTLGADTVHLTRYTGEKALEFIDQCPEEQPFCLSLSFSAPHAHDRAEAQYFWQEVNNELYEGVEMPGPVLSEDTWFEKLPLFVREGLNRTRWYWRYDTPEKYQHSVKGYYRMIRGVDMEIARIRKKLKEKGLEKNTVIMLMGDNGYFLGERQLAGKWLLYDNSIRVPLIIYDPRVKKHRDIDDMVMNIDVPATILELAGAERPGAWQGRSLVPVVSGTEESLHRDTILIEHIWEYKDIPPSEGIRTPEWKYFRYVNDRSSVELYDLENDPMEIVNLAGDTAYCEILQELQNSCDRLIQRYADPFSGTPTEMSVEPGLLPEYRWILPEAAGKQQAYQILVASERSLVESNRGDVWNSGQVRSDQTRRVVHGGDPLELNRTYYWKVRIWDQDNRHSEYSQVQRFTSEGL